MADQVEPEKISNDIVISKIQDQFKPEKLTNADLISRIEDQLIDKFNFKFKGYDLRASKYTREELINLMINWSQFWYNEIPLCKKSLEVVNIKRTICNMKILAIYAYAERLGLSDNMPEMILTE